MRRLLPWVLLVVLAAAFGRGLVDGGGGSATGPRTAHVLRIVDGDTILVQVAGARERVRYIGMDTPESVKPGTPVQCYAKAASRRNASLVAGRDVRLVLGVEPRDRYGRMLAYVYRRSDGLFVNAELVRGGYARPLTIAPNVRFARQLDALARTARTDGRGLWAACAK